MVNSKSLKVIMSFFLVLSLFIVAPLQAFAYTLTKTNLNEIPPGELLINDSFRFRNPDVVTGGAYLSSITNIYGKIPSYSYNKWNQNNTFKFRWNNVGVDLDEDPIDIEVTIKLLTQRSNPNGEYHIIMNYKAYDGWEIGGPNEHIEWELVYNFYKRGTTNPARGNYLNIFNDVDAPCYDHAHECYYCESLKVVSGIEQTYVYPNCRLKIQDSNKRFRSVAWGDNIPQDAVVMVMNNGSKITTTNQQGSIALFETFYPKQPLIYNLQGGTNTNQFITTVAQAKANDYKYCYPYSSTQTLVNTIPVRPGYKFIGWSNNPGDTEIDTHEDFDLALSKKITRKYINRGTNIVYAMWMKEKVTQSFNSEPKKVISIFKDDEDPIIDDSSKTINVDPNKTKPENDANANWLYYYGETDGGEYEYESQPGNRVGDDEIYEMQVKTIIRNIEITASPDKLPYKNEDVFNEINETGEANREWDIKQWFTSETKEYERDVEIRFNTPENKEKLLTPFNINNQSNITESDPAYNFINKNTIGESLSITPDSKTKDKNEIDRFLSLDINNDNSISVDIQKDSSYGVGNLKFEDPDQLENIWYEETDPNEEYNNNRIGDLSYFEDDVLNGVYRYNMNFNYKINSPYNFETASIIDNVKNEEITNLESLTFNYLKDNYLPTFYQVRFTLTGEYTTGNDVENCPEELRNYWINYYDQKRFYEYGISYKGKFDVDGIYQPELTYNVDEHKVNNPEINEMYVTDDIIKNEIKTNGTSDRGLYVTDMHKTVYQPVAYGKWGVKTLALDTRY